MSASVLLAGALASTTHLLAGVIPNPSPIDPTGGNAGISLIIGIFKWGAILACGLAMLVAAGELAVGAVSHRPDHSDRGKRALGWAIGGAIVAAIAIPIINTVFSAAAN